MQWLIDGLLAVHVLAMCISASGALICLPLERRSARGAVLAPEAGRFVLATSLAMLLGGGFLGVVAGWLRWEAGLSEVLSRLPSKVYFGIWELAFSAVLMLGHWFWWRRSPHPRGASYVARLLIALLAGTNLLYHFPVLFVVISDLLHHQQTQGAVISASEFRRLLVEPAILSRVLHIVLASLIAAASLLWVYTLRKTRTAPSADAEALGTLGARLALLPVLLQIPVGFWTFVQMSPLAQRRVLGADPVAALLFVLGLAAALWLAHLVAGIALGESQASKLRRAITALALTILLMTLTSRRAMVP